MNTPHNDRISLIRDEVLIESIVFYMLYFITTKILDLCDHIFKSEGFNLLTQEFDKRAKNEVERMLSSHQSLCTTKAHSYLLQAIEKKVNHQPNSQPDILKIPIDSISKPEYLY